MALTRDFGEGTVKSVVVEFAPEKAVAAALSSSAPGDDRLARLEKVAGVKPEPVFGKTAQMAKGAVPAAFGVALNSNVGNFFRVEVDDPEEVKSKAEEIKAALKDEVASVIPEPLAIPALAPPAAELAAGPAVVPDFTSLQWHLHSAPMGLGVLDAWRFLGAAGQGVKVIDVEGGWSLDHVALSGVRFNLWSGSSQNSAAWRNHGTAVAGLLAAPVTGPGVAGICPLARVGLISAFAGDPANQRVAAQILASLEFVGPGDVLLIELQRPGPAVDFQANPEQKGYIPVSYWPDVSAAIASVAKAGVCVVEVGGNGGENLDEKTYEDRFNQAKNDPGSIMVGAGAPPSGEFGAARSRMPYSNYGSRMDCQAGGGNVVTSGYGDLFGADDATRAYTGRFMGTSSAGPLVAGVVAGLQGRFRAVNGYPISPAEVRSALANIGAPQAARPEAPASQRIGPQPDLITLLSAFRVI
jgi:subtilisin family serine protease